MTESRSRYLAWCMLLACAFLFTRQIYAQEGAQSASNPQQSPASATKEATGFPHLQLRVPLVVEDVVVLDDNDEPAHGLNASDFAVTENGKPVEVRDFAENIAAPAPAAPVKPLDLGPNTFTNLPRADLGPSLNIVLLDALNTPMEDQFRVRQQMLSFLKDLSPNKRFAVFGLATHLYLLQGFTSDPAVLRAAIEQKRSRAISPLLDDPVSGGPGTAMADTLRGATLPGSVLASVQEFEAEQQTANLQRRMLYTLNAMNQLARYLSALPGRKNLIWFSGSFPLNILPNMDLSNPFAGVDNFSDDVRQTAELFARSRVAVYPIDARGLLNNPAWSVANVGPLNAKSKGTTNSSIIARANSAANHKFFAETNAEYDTMDLIAKETGGKAFYMTNGLRQAVEKALDYGENYYTITYTPTNQNWNGSYRKVSIKTDQPDLRLYFRPGYLADNPDAPTAGDKKVLPFDAMQTAMLRGGPDATQVLFDVRIIPAEKPSNELSPGARPPSTLTDATRMKPPYMRYTVRVLVDLESVKLATDGKGAHHGAAGLAVVVYDSDGVPVNSAVKEVAIDVPPDRYTEALAKGAGAHLDIDVPSQGEYFMRIGVKDLTGNRVGALEVPVSALKSFGQLRDGARN
jgi:VWFA-related protein